MELAYYAKLKLATIRDDVIRFENDLLTSRAESNAKKVKDAKGNLPTILLQEEIMWREKSRIKWLKEGDRNTPFSHATCKAKANRAKIQLQMEDGSLCSNADVIGSKAV